MANAERLIISWRQGAAAFNFQEVLFMANLSELDLQNLRHLIGGYDVSHCKMKEYASSATDSQIKQFFEKGAKSAMDNKNELMKFLQ